MSNSTTGTCTADSMGTESTAGLTGKHKVFIMVGVMAVLASIIVAVVKNR